MRKRGDKMEVDVVVLAEGGIITEVKVFKHTEDARGYKQSLIEEHGEVTNESSHDIFWVEREVEE